MIFIYFCLNASTTRYFKLKNSAPCHTLNDSTDNSLFIIKDHTFTHAIIFQI